MTDVVMPQMGESIVEGTLTRWLKKPGEKVERDEPLFEISTDKVDTEIPSPTAGVLSEVLVQEGTTVAINSIVARIGDGAAPSAQPAAAPPSQEARPPAPAQETRPAASTPPSVDVGPSAAAKTAEPPTPASSGAGPYPSQPAGQAAPPPPAPVSQPDGQDDQGPLSPLVRKMAREYNIDLAQVKGTGAGGRITKQDVEAYMSTQAARTYAAPSHQPVATSAGPYPIEPQPATQAAQGAPAQAPAVQAQPAAPLPLAESAKVSTEPMSVMRQRIAEHMVMSKRTSAHVTTVHRIDMTKIAKLRDRSKTEFQARNGKRSANDLPSRRESGLPKPRCRDDREHQLTLLRHATGAVLSPSNVAQQYDRDGSVFSRDGRGLRKITKCSEINRVLNLSGCRQTLFCA
jgi:pyruvate dehydrogenase E2 component (dihydrolipoamide acetyltransferase)